MIDNRNAQHLQIDGRVALPFTEQRDMRPAGEDRTYRIFVAIPAEPPPPEGYPVIYVLDANAVFATMAETMRVQSRRADKTGVAPAVVVGIGYPTDEPFSPGRFYDFTLPRAEGEGPYTFKNMTIGNCGGAERFLAFIEEELKPAIERDYAVDRERQALVGHSLGGLFVLQVLLTKPGAFRSYIAGSPSIHWNERFVFDALPRLTDRLAEAETDIRLLVAVGSLETSHRMIDNAREFARRLIAGAPDGTEVLLRIFEDDGHVSLLPALMSAAVRFASRAE